MKNGTGKEETNVQPTKGLVILLLYINMGILRGYQNYFVVERVRVVFSTY